MRNLLIIGAICALALAVGGFLYWHTSLSQASLTAAGANAGASEGRNIPIKVLDQGENAFDMASRKNIAIYDPIAFADFWKKAHGTDGTPLPSIDFSKNYVIAVFAGTVPSSGYSIEVDKVTDEEDARSVAVLIEEPDASCRVIQEDRHPYQFVSVAFTDATALAHTDVRTKRPCQ
jgi:hypothetical protein